MSMSIPPAYFASRVDTILNVSVTQNNTYAIKYNGDAIKFVCIVSGLSVAIT